EAASAVIWLANVRMAPPLLVTITSDNKTGEMTRRVDLACVIACAADEFCGLVCSLSRRPRECVQYRPSTGRVANSVTTSLPKCCSNIGADETSTSCGPATARP